MPEMLSKDEAATRAGKTTKTISNWIRAGHIKARRDDAGRQVVDPASLDAYLASLGKTPAKLPDGAKGLPELVSLLEKERERSALLQQRNTDLEWQNGRLMGEIKALKDHPALLLGTGEAVPSPQETPGETVSEAAAPPDGLWARVGRWWKGEA